jgi:hypothetical protein
MPTIKHNHIISKIFSSRLFTQIYFGKPSIIISGIFAFILIYFTISVIFSIPNVSRFSEDYSGDAINFVLPNNFDIYAYADSLQRTVHTGFVFPYLLAIFMKISIGIFQNDYYFGAKLFVCSLNAILVMVLPYLFKEFRKKRIGILSRLMPIIVLLIFFNGIFKYVISDVIALPFLVFSACLLKLSVDDDYTSINFKLFMWKRKTIHVVLNFILLKIFPLVFAGAFLYAAYNIRTIYLFSVIPLFILYFVSLIRKFKWKASPMILSLIIGIMLVGNIQGIINMHIGNDYSILDPQGIPAKELPKANLFTWQLHVGLAYTKYSALSTLDDDNNMINLEGWHFNSKVGQKVLEEENLASGYDIAFDISHSKQLNYKQYFTICLKHPFEIINIYFYHLIALFTPDLGGGAYTDISTVGDNILFMSFLNITLLFISCLWILICLKQQYSSHLFDATIKFRSSFDEFVQWIFRTDILVLFTIFIMPVLAIMPGAIEQRFGIPGYLLILGIVFFNTNYHKILQVIIRHKVLIAITFILCSCLYFMFLTDILSDNTLPSKVNGIDSLYIPIH